MADTLDLLPYEIREHQIVHKLAGIIILPEQTDLFLFALYGKD